jgi:predicted transposase/invertase (TIGR01784 family)
MHIQTKTVFYDKLTYFFLELPKFDKRQEELACNFDRWVYLLKNLPGMSGRPEALQGRVFDMLFRAAEIAWFTPKEMEKYNKSILEYSDVRDAVEYARETGREEGVEQEKILIARKCLEKNMPIDDIIDLTGLSKEQILDLREKR